MWRKLRAHTEHCRISQRFIWQCASLPIISLLLSATTVHVPNAHDFHTSLTQMQFAPKEQTIEISIRLFTDDLEKALTRENGGRPVTFAGTSKPAQLLERYVRKHFIMADEQRKARPYTYVGYEEEADAQWVYLEMPASGPMVFKNVVIKQDILMELFNDQVNLVNIQYNQQKKTVVFRNNQPVQSVSL